MRMRKKKHGAERIEACAELRISDASLMKNGFEEIFSNPAPVHMEIGCGKGNFACGMAEKYPDVNFVAVERVADVCCIALEKAKAATQNRKSDNLRFLIGDAKTLTENLLPHSLDCNLIRLTAYILTSATPGPRRVTPSADLHTGRFLKITEDFSSRTE